MRIRSWSARTLVLALSLSVVTATFVASTSEPASETSSVLHVSEDIAGGGVGSLPTGRSPFAASTPPVESRSQPAETASPKAARTPRATAKSSRAARKKPKKKKRLTRRQRIGFITPAQGWVTSGYGKRPSGRHHGIDFACPWGSPILASKAGQVIYKKPKHPVYGRTLVLKHAGGYTSLYAHMSGFNTKTGHRVKKGQKIGRCGNSGRSTGNHLHFELRKGGRFLNPGKYLS